MRASIAVAGLTALALAACAPSGPAPDLVISGGRIYTGLDQTPVVEAISVGGGRILATGSAKALLRTANASTRKIDLKGAVLYPGFTDAHAHLRGIGERELTLNLDGIGSIADLVKAVGEAAAKAPPGPLQGRGWIETHWPEARFPTRQDIDAVTGDRPVVLVRADGHALLANTAALKAAGIDGKPRGQPDGGRIEVDKAGLPTGMLIDNAMGLLSGLAARPSDARIDQAYEVAGQHETALGWTGVHNMSVPGADVARINALSRAGKLKLRVYNAVEASDAGDFSPEMFGHPAGGLVTTRAIKLYMDGALGSRGALLEAPYSDRPDITGLMRMHEAPTLALLKRAYDAGVQVCIHAIGDRGNRLALDWMQKTFEGATPTERAARDPRWRIEHAQILRPEDIPRFKQLGVIPSMQPSHAIGDLYFAPARLGPDRLAGAYAWRSLIDAGSIIPGGSDAPVEKGDPRIEFYAAVARKDLQGKSGPDWHPEQRVTRAEALKMFTAWPAYASFREKDLGTIEPGKLADFTAFSGDLMTLPEADILKVEPVLTVVGGVVAFQRAG